MKYHNKLLKKSPYLSVHNSECRGTNGLINLSVQYLNHLELLTILSVEVMNFVQI